ncbi:MAG: anaerobic ribonucleoside-triphosphate reductase, partial [Culicoidibacterales bacterium]
MVIKRDGQKQPFKLNKIEEAITKAYRATGEILEEDVLTQITTSLLNQIEIQELDVETIQDLVEKQLMHTNSEVAKRYILYREQRTAERKKRTKEKFILDGIVAVEKNDVNNENANMSAHTPAGQMMTFASETTKDYTHHYLLAPKYSQAHRSGAIHIHDLDYYP